VVHARLWRSIGASAEQGVAAEQLDRGDFRIQRREKRHPELSM